MIAVLDQIAMGMLVLGLLAVGAGIGFIIVTHLKVAVAQPEFWKSLFYFFSKRVTYQMHVAQLALDAENTTRSGKIADWLLKRGTALLIVGGFTKAFMFFIERQSV